MLHWVMKMVASTVIKSWKKYKIMRMVVSNYEKLLSIEIFNINKNLQKNTNLWGKKYPKYVNEIAGQLLKPK